MILNNGNRVQGLYNANTAPDEVMYTENDIVVYGTTLYVCLQDTQLKPSLDSPNWKLYMGDNWRYLDSLEAIENPDTSKVNYIGPQGLSQYIKSRLGGLNSDGRVQILSDATLYPLYSLTKNSIFQLDQLYITDTSGEILPFSYREGSVYIVKTISELKRNFVEDYFVQEIYEYKADGNYECWVRHGVDLAVATWQAARGESFNSDFINSLNTLVSKYQESEIAYKTLVNEIHSGNYYSFELVPLPSSLSTIVKFEDIEKPVNGNQLTLSRNYHYKIFLRQQVSENSYTNRSFDICPEDFNFTISPNAQVSYLNGEVLLKRSNYAEDSVEERFWSIETNLSIVRILRAKNLIS